MNVAVFIAAWESHPDYQPGPIPCVGVFSHDTGICGSTESYIIGGIQDVFANIKWGEEKLGKFTEVCPVWGGIPVDPYFVTVLSTSLKSKAAQAKAARDELKRLLPRRLHRLISKARQANSKPKWLFLPPDVDAAAPAWYTTSTKKELFVERRLTQGDRDDLSRYIDPLAFYDCATGKIPHDKVKDFCLYQPRLDEVRS
jgi:hypothetical protein